MCRVKFSFIPQILNTKYILNELLSSEFKDLFYYIKLIQDSIFQCPHDLVCPRLSADNTPCNFEVGYTSSSLIGNETTQTERYSYVVLKKGKKPFLFS